MKTKLLTAVSAAALLGISSFALAQGTGASGGAGATGAAPSTQAPSGAGSSSTQNSPSGGSTAGERAQSKDHMKNQAQEEKGSQKSNQAQGMEKDRMGKDTQKSNQAQGMEKDRMGKDTQKSNQAQTPSESKSQMSQDKEGSKSSTTVGAASSGGVNLTTEQRTTIRKDVLTSSAPRATNINFAVSVGTVVPHDVRVVEVPETIVRIHPAWRGYRYFVYNDEIVIVEPRSLKIVAVLEV